MPLEFPKTERIPENLFQDGTWRAAFHPPATTSRHIDMILRYF